MVRISCVSIKSGVESFTSSGYVTILSITSSGMSGLSTLSNDNGIISDSRSVILNPGSVMFDVEGSKSVLLVSSRL